MAKRSIVTKINTLTGEVVSTSSFVHNEDGTITHEEIVPVTPPEPEKVIEYITKTEYVTKQIEDEYLNKIIFVFNDETESYDTIDSRWTNLHYQGNGIYIGEDPVGNCVIMQDSPDDKTVYIKSMDKSGDIKYDTYFTYTDTAISKHEWPEWYKNIPPNLNLVYTKDGWGTAVYKFYDETNITSSSVQYMGNNIYRNLGSGAIEYSVVEDGVIKMDYYTNTTYTTLAQTKYKGYVYSNKKYEDKSFWNPTPNTEFFTLDADQAKNGTNNLKPSKGNSIYARAISNNMYIAIGDPDSNGDRYIYIYRDMGKGAMACARVEFHSDNNFQVINTLSPTSTCSLSSVIYGYAYGTKGDPSKYQ